MTIGFVVVIDILYQGDYFFPLSPKRRRILSHYYRIIIVVVFCTYRLVDWWSSHCVQRGRLIECSVTSQLYDMQSDFMYILNDATQVVQSSLYHTLSEAWNYTAFLMFLQLYNDAAKTVTTLDINSDISYFHQVKHWRLDLSQRLDGESRESISLVRCTTMSVNFAPQSHIG